MLGSVMLMVVSIAMFGLIAEDVVHVVEGVLKLLGVSQAFLGLTLIALTPAATELASAIKFALAGQINLSVEIGSASAVQVRYAWVFLVFVDLFILLLNPRPHTTHPCLGYLTDFPHSNARAHPHIGNIQREWQGRPAF